VDEARPCVPLTPNFAASFILVRPRNRSLAPPSCEEPDAHFSRFQVSTATRMMAIVETERAQVALAEKDAKRFRDEEGLTFLSVVDSHIDEAHLMWSRLLPKPGVVAPQQQQQAAAAARSPPSSAPLVVRYQRANGARDFIHPLDMKVLLRAFPLTDLPSEIPR
jgi:hypothetical protein